MKVKKFCLMLFAVVLCCALLAGCKPEGDLATLDDLKGFIGTTGGGTEEPGGNTDPGGSTDPGGNGGQTPGGDVTPKEVTLYLLPGKGYTIGGAAGVDDSIRKLENSYVFTGHVGDTLPVPDKKDGVEFVGWCRPSHMNALPVLKAPNADGAILSAMWSKSGSGGGAEIPDTPDVPDPPPDPDTPIGTADFYLAFDGTIDEQARFAENPSAATEDKEYVLTYTFTAGQEFTFMSKAPLTTTSTETTYPTSANRGFSLGNDAVNEINTHDYFEAVDVDKDGTNEMGDYWANTSSAKLKCVTAGKYTLYVTVYDNGWVKVFSMPVA